MRRTTFSLLSLCALNFSRLDSVDDLDLLSTAVSRVISNAWEANARNITVTTRSKKWWNNKCRDALVAYKCTGAREDWHLFRSTTRSTKQSFFDDRIAEIASTSKRPWDLMSWVKQRKLSAVEAIQYQGLSCNSLPNVWHTLHSSYNAAANHSVQLSILDNVPCLAPRPWVSFSMLEMSEALKTCSNVFALGPDHITWCYPQEYPS